MRYQLFLLILLASFATAEIQNVSAQSDPAPEAGKPEAGNPEDGNPKDGKPEAGKPKDGDTEEPDEKKDDVALAVIVHPKNSIKKVSFSELRAYLKARRQFWPNKKRCDLFLPPTTSPAYKLLLKNVYKTTHKKLQKYWTRKQFSGDIATKPSYVSSFKAAGVLVLAREGALSVVPANRVPEGARVLLIDGKKPGDEGYKLSGKKSDKKE